MSAYTGLIIGKNLDALFFAYELPLRLTKGAARILAALAELNVADCFFFHAEFLCRFPTAEFVGVIANIDNVVFAFEFGLRIVDALCIRQ